MNKTFFVVLAALPLVAGCWPFSKEEAKQSEMTEAVAPAAEEVTAPSEEESSKEEAEVDSEEDENIK